MAEAIAGDVFEIAPGAIHAQLSDLNNYHSNNLNSALLSITKPGITLRNMAGQGRWSLYPDRTQAASGRNGICIYSPGASEDMVGRGSFVIVGFEFDNWGTDAAVRVMSGSKVSGSYENMHASLVLRSFKVGRRIGELSASGISGAVETLLVEDGHVYDCGDGSGQEHNAYVSARTMTWRGVRLSRTRGWLGVPYAAGSVGIEGHVFKLSAVTGLIEGCLIDCAALADQSLLLQMKAGGNWTVRNNWFFDSKAPNNANGAILMEREYGTNGEPNYEWWAGIEGNSLLFEKNTYVGHYPRPIVFFRDPVASPNPALYPAGDASVAPARRLSSFVCRNNVAMVTDTQAYGSWMLSGFPGADNAMWLMRDPNGGANWAARGNTTLPYDEAEAARIMATAVNDYNSALSGGTIDTSVPAWRAAMTQTNTVYAIGEPNSVLEGQPVWPHGGSTPPALWGENEIETVINHGWTGVVHAEDASRYGKLINQSAGEFSLPNNVQAFDLTTGTWEMWQQPLFALDQAGAEAIDADCYYDPTEYAGLASTQKSDATHTWNPSTYPLGANKVGSYGWIWYRKALTLSLGSGTSYVNRYNSSAWLPSSMTGLGAGVRVVNEDTLCGPGGGGRLTGSANDADWYDASRLWGSGKNKFYVRYQNTVSKARGRFPVPNPEASNGADITRNASCVDVASKRLYYYTAGGAPGHGIFYYDLTAGIAGATVSALLSLTLPQGDPVFGLGRGSRVFTEGHPSGRRLWYFLDEGIANTLFMIDLDTTTGYRLTIPGLDIHSGSVDYAGVSFAYMQGKLVLVSRRYDNPSVIKMHVVTIPSDPTVEDDYSSVTTTLAIAAGTTIETSGANFIYPYGWGTYMERLGVIVLKQDRQHLLAFRPSI